MRVLLHLRPSGRSALRGAGPAAAAVAVRLPVLLLSRTAPTGVTRWGATLLLLLLAESPAKRPPRALVVIWWGCCLRMMGKVRSPPRRHGRGSVGRRMRNHQGPSGLLWRVAPPVQLLPAGHLTVVHSLCIALMVRRDKGRWPQWTRAAVADGIGRCQHRPAPAQDAASRAPSPCSGRLSHTASRAAVRPTAPRWTIRTAVRTAAKATACPGLGKGRCAHYSGRRHRGEDPPLGAPAGCPRVLELVPLCKLGLANRSAGSIRRINVVLSWGLPHWYPTGARRNDKNPSQSVHSYRN